MKREILCVAAGLLIAVGCGGNEEAEAEAEAQAEALAAQLGAALDMAAMEATMEAAPAAAAAAAPAAGGSNFGTVTLNPGFVPDPHTATGNSGGSTDAATLNADCVGFVSDTPDHLLVTTGAFSSLRVMAHAEQDITLVIQKPDGTYACNDDHDGTNPLVEGAMAPGTYKIWVGSYEAGATSSYKLGFSELSSVTPSSLAAN
ncbi:MAG: hypothetical protein AAGE52_17500 [Myxococcota bacterium]